MLMLGALLMVACLIGIAGARLFPELRIAGLVAATGLVAIVAWVAWWGLLFFQVVRIDPMLRLLNVYRFDSIGRTVVFLGPPLVAAGAFAAAMSRRRSRGQDGNRGRRA